MLVLLLPDIHCLLYCILNVWQQHFGVLHESQNIHSDIPWSISLRYHAALRICRNEKLDTSSDVLKTVNFSCTSTCVAHFAFFRIWIRFIADTFSPDSISWSSILQNGVHSLASTFAAFICPTLSVYFTFPRTIHAGLRVQHVNQVHLEPDEYLFFVTLFLFSHQPEQWVYWHHS